MLQPTPILSCFLYRPPLSPLYSRQWAACYSQTSGFLLKLLALISAHIDHHSLRSSYSVFKSHLKLYALAVLSPHTVAQNSLCCNFPNSCVGTMYFNHCSQASGFDSDTSQVFSKWSLTNLCGIWLFQCLPNQTINYLNAGWSLLQFFTYMSSFPSTHQFLILPQNRWSSKRNRTRFWVLGLRRGKENNWKNFSWGWHHQIY